ncbi:MAG: hypothetical protein ACXWEY_14400 [Bacteroidia bacterium]
MFIFTDIDSNSLSASQRYNADSIIDSRTSSTMFMLEHKYVSMNHLLLEKSYFYANFREDSVVKVIGNFDRFFDWGDFLWFGKTYDIYTNKNISSIVISGRGKEIQLGTGVTIYRSPQEGGNYVLSYNSIPLGGYKYLMGKFINIGEKSNILFECESPYTDLEFALALEGSQQWGLIMNPLGKLGNEIKFCTEFNMQVEYNIIDMAGRIITLMERNYAPGAYIQPLPFPKLRPGMYIFKLRIKSKVYPNGIYEKYIKVVKQDK